jgi:hypothetical protein
MKIIGQTEDGFLISASRDEIANLVGFYFGGADGCPQIKVGVEIPINKLWTRLYTLQQSEGIIRSLAQNLESFARDIKETQPLIWPEEKPKDGGLAK